VVVDTPHVVQVTSDQAANALGISNGGQVAIGAGASLSVTTGTSVTSNGTLNVNPNGAFSTGGTLTLDSGGSLIGGPIAAAAYQLNDGTASAKLIGSGGLTKSTDGTVILSGADSYAGGTVVNAGTLIVTNAGALPDGTSLTVGAGGLFVFDPSQSASSSSAMGLAAPAPHTAATSETSRPIVTARALDNAPVSAPTVSNLSPFSERQIKNLSYPAVSERQAKDLSYVPAVMSKATIDAVFASHRSALDQTVFSADNAHSALPWAWLAVMESSGNSSDQDQTTNAKVEALDKVLARFGL
jgi:autotransporter-associated beta strand protein